MHFLSNIHYQLSVVCRGSRRGSVNRGFTLIEMVAVVLILSLLMAAMVTGLSRARNAAWRVQARETCRELCEAWNAYLLEERAFPEKKEFDLDGGNSIPATADNIRFLSGKSDVTSKVYLELNEEEKNKDKRDGLKDHWGNRIYFMLDFDYAGEIDNPHPAANGLGNNTKVRASAIAWSPGSDTKGGQKMPREDRWIVVW